MEIYSLANMSIAIRCTHLHICVAAVVLFVQTLRFIGTAFEKTTLSLFFSMCFTQGCPIQTVLDF